MKDEDELAGALREALWTSRNSIDDLNVVDGLFAIAKSIDRVADALHALGNGDAATKMGALEAYGLHMGEKLDALTEAIGARDEVGGSHQ